jgi:hypothetical protein
LDTESPADLTARIDLTLGSDPRFGSAEAIEVRNLARYRLGLGVLARHHPHAADRLERLCQADDAELRPVMYDPVLRNAFENDLTALERQAGENGALVGYLEGGAADVLDGLGPCERLSHPRVRPWPGHAVSWVWTDLEPGSAPERVLAARLEELLAGTLSKSGSGGRVRPDAGMLAGLSQGAELLAELLPNAGAGVLPHRHRSRASRKRRAACSSRPAGPRPASGDQRGGEADQDVAEARGKRESAGQVADSPHGDEAEACDPPGL